MQSFSKKIFSCGCCCTSSKEIPLKERAKEKAPIKKTPAEKKVGEIFTSKMNDPVLEFLIKIDDLENLSRHDLQDIFETYLYADAPKPVPVSGIHILKIGNTASFFLSITKLKTNRQEMLNLLKEIGKGLEDRDFTNFFS